MNEVTVQDASVVAATINKNFIQCDDSNIKLSLVGDDHGENSCFSVFLNNNKSPSFLAKRSPCIRAEHLCGEALRSAQNILEIKNASIPVSAISDDGTWLIRQYFEGPTIAQLEVFDYRIRELTNFLCSVEALNSYCANPLQLLIASEHEFSETSFKSKAVSILRLYPWYKQLRNELAKFLKIDIPGEGFRFVIDDLWHLYKSPLKSKIGVSFDLTAHSNNTIKYVFGNSITRNKISEKTENLSTTLGYLSAMLSFVQVYDMHAGNFVMHTNQYGPSVVPFDFECFGGGESRRLIPFMFSSITAAYQTLGINDPDKDRLNYLFKDARRHGLRRLASSKEKFTIYFPPKNFYKRVVLNGTESYELMITLIKESVFYVCALEYFDSSDICLDDHEDIIRFIEPWNYFQYWKRTYRLFNKPSMVSEEMNEEVLTCIQWLRETPHLTPPNKLANKCYELILSLRKLNFDCEVTKTILDRVVAMVASPTYELYYKTKTEITRKKIEKILMKKDNKKIQITDMDIASIVRRTTLEILNFHIPLHVARIDTPILVHRKKFLSAVKKMKTLDNVRNKLSGTSIKPLIEGAWARRITKTKYNERA